MKDNKFADYNRLKSNKRQKERQESDSFHQAMLNAKPEEIQKMVEDRWGKKPPKLTHQEKKEFSKMKKEMGEENFKVLKADDKEADEIAQLRWLIDDETLKPHYEGKVRSTSNKRAKPIKLSTAWVNYHFTKSYLNMVQKMGRGRPREQRWVHTPLGYNSNIDELDVKNIRMDIPIECPQGETKSCLFSSLASAFTHMGHRTIAYHIHENMGPLVEQDARSQWQGLVAMLAAIRNETFRITKFNFKPGKKKTPKHKLDIIQLASERERRLDVHVVALIGADGSESHAVAVVDGLIFDSSAKHAMILNKASLDWCCNCVNGFAKIGTALCIKIKNCTFKATRQIS